MARIPTPGVPDSEDCVLSMPLPNVFLEEGTAHARKGEDKWKAHGGPVRRKEFA